jgi:peroxiredoxin
MNKKLLIFLLLMFLIVPIISNGCHSNSTQDGTKSLAPDFSWKDNNDEVIKLSDLKGKVVLLDFWATWCSPCRETILHVEAIYEKYKDKGVEVIGINMDESSKINAVVEFIKDNGMKYQVISDANGNVGSQYSVTSIPRFFIIDKKGNIDKMIIGYDPDMEIIIGTEIDKLLKE